MRKGRRVARIATSDSEEEVPPPPPPPLKDEKLKLPLKEEAEEEETQQEDAKPIGEVIKVYGKGRNKKDHYAEFEYDGSLFKLEDFLLLTPEEDCGQKKQKPYLAIIKMTDARCPRCREKKVGLTDIIQAGARGDRYQLGCIAWGYSWYAFREELSTLTIDGPSVVGNVGTAPWATAKFDDVEKKLQSPRESEKQDAAAVVDLLKTTSKPKMAVLESDKSLNKTVGQCFVLCSCMHSR